ncbi:hypothetical protein ONA91_37755 [Micromonospora sp. DR5-3]|uniref:hypothetical protein n=1 Tax=unclassified Micromonospora TaxID=2617518 RepID=UPI0011D53B58|nr:MULTISPECIES: hypothetical protein [unclassified Micromonospora]MCW3820191.1 hypothetical protein [Micromonospora sp. DR5-3]TYC19507.1 hypothetical protein FXF52_36275 [Micromonospora sp. MP36]
MIWDEVRRQVLQEDDLILLQECRLCYEAGAWRAAYIMAFLAGMEGLERRIDEMAVGDAALGRGLRQARESPSSKEASLIDLAAKHEFLTDNEKKRLHAVREMRNDYAHASQLSPKAYEVEVAVRTVVDLVLARPSQVLPGRARALARELATDVHRLPPGVDAEKRFVAEVAPRVHRSARAVMLKELLQSREETGQLNRNLTARVVNVARQMLATWRPDLGVAAGWNLDRLLSESPAMAAKVLIHPEVWSLVPTDYRSRVLGAAQKHEPELWPAMVRILHSGIEVEGREMLLQKIRELPLHDWPYASAPPLKELLPAILDVFNGWSLQAAKWTADRLSDVPAVEFEKLDPDERSRLASALERAGDPKALNSWGVRDDIKLLAARTDLPRDFHTQLQEAWARIGAESASDATAGHSEEPSAEE